MGRVTSRRRVIHLSHRGVTTRPDTLAGEEPLEIRVAGRALAVTMRTPGHDFDLTAGFLVSEGVIRGSADIRGIRYCAGAVDDGTNTYNVVDVTLAPAVRPPDASAERNFYTTSSCGVCGKASLDAVRTSAFWSVRDDPVRFGTTMLEQLPDQLRAAQLVFERTGGLHAAGVFTADGQLLCAREDVGRHNAVDKVLGWAAREDRLPLTGTILMVSGRASFELVQKAVMGAIPALAAVSAPSSLAADLAAETGLTLVGFLRGSSMNVYSGAHRMGLESPDQLGA